MSFQTEIIVVIFIVIIAIIVICKKNIDSKNITHNKPKIQSILKKSANTKKSDNTKKEIKFYDVRMAKNSNDILFKKNIKPTTELLNMYPPILKDIPTNNDVFQGRKENKELRWNI